MSKPITVAQAVELFRALPPDTPILLPGSEDDPPWIPASAVYEGRAVLIVPAALGVELLAEITEQRRGGG